MVSTTYRSKAQPWVLEWPPLMPTSLWGSLRQKFSLHTTHQHLCGSGTKPTDTLLCVWQIQMCKTCSTLLTTNTFTSKTTGRSYLMRCSATCKSSNIIYLIQCRKCGCQYVGETEQALNERMNSHRTDIRHKAEKPVAIHLNTTGHKLEDLQVMVTERLWRNDSAFRKIRESRWISSL